MKQIHRKLWENYKKVNFIILINQGVPSPVWKSSKKSRVATMSPLHSKVYKGRSRGETSGKERGKKRGGGRSGRGRGQRSMSRRGHGGNVAEADVEMSESQRLKELRKTQEQGLWVKSFFILQIFIPAN